MSTKTKTALLVATLAVTLVARALISADTRGVALVLQLAATALAALVAAGLASEAVRTGVGEAVRRWRAAPVSA